MINLHNIELSAVEPTPICGRLLDQLEWDAELIDTLFESTAILASLVGDGRAVILTNDAIYHADADSAEEGDAHRQMSFDFGDAPEEHKEATCPECGDKPFNCDCEEQRRQEYFMDEMMEMAEAVFTKYSDKMDSRTRSAFVRNLRGSFMYALDIIDKYDMAH